MSDIFDLTDNLLDTISSIVSAKNAAREPREVGSRSSRSVQEINSMNIVEDCISSLLTDETTNGHYNENRSYEVIVGEDISYDPGIERDTEPSLCHLRKDEAEGQQEGDFVFQAAKGRIARDKERKKGNPPKEKGTGAMVASSKEDAQAEKIGDAEIRATDCFNSFRSDVRSFYGRWEGQEDIQGRISSAHIFAEHLTERYSNRLERLPRNVVKVSKIQTIISGFIRRCRVVGEGKRDSAVDVFTDPSSLDKLCTKILRIPKPPAKTQEQLQGQVPKIFCKFKYWTCRVCGKNDLPFENFKCSCCGRPKTYRPLPIEKEPTPMRDPIAEEKAFLCKGTFVHPMEVEERVRRQHLYRKFDYDTGQRTELKRDVEEVITSIQQMVESIV